MFNQQELQVLLGGTTAPIDPDDLRRNVVYSGPFDEAHPTIRLFWDVFGELDDAHRRQLVKYVTSCSRPPLSGFSALNPKFCIAFSSGDQDRLPTASTCVNLLKLPAYKEKENLRRKLIYAITYGAGFDMS
ncbi:hypothetical protein HK405_013661 [Cladochytrium tenue]|nr:hypothetical protein HK405_013661 [Cladochytrium tenue]